MVFEVFLFLQFRRSVVPRLLMSSFSSKRFLPSLLLTKGWKGRRLCRVGGTGFVGGHMFFFFFFFFFSKPFEMEILTEKNHVLGVVHE